MGNGGGRALKMLSQLVTTRPWKGRKPSLAVAVGFTSNRSKTAHLWRATLPPVPMLCFFTSPIKTASTVSRHPLLATAAAGPLGPLQHVRFRSNHTTAGSLTPSGPKLTGLRHASFRLSKNTVCLLPKTNWQITFTAYVQMCLPCSLGTGRPKLPTPVAKSFPGSRSPLDAAKTRAAIGRLRFVSIEDQSSMNL